METLVNGVPVASPLSTPSTLVVAEGDPRGEAGLLLVAHAGRVGESDGLCVTAPLGLLQRGSPTGELSLPPR